MSTALTQLYYHTMARPRVVSEKESLLEGESGPTPAEKTLPTPCQQDRSWPSLEDGNGDFSVCVCCRPIYSERRFSPLGRVSRGHTGGRPTHRRFLFFYLFLILHLPSAVLAFLFCREKGSALPFPRRPRSRIFRVPTTKSLSTVGCCARKTPRSLRDLNPRPNRQKVTRLPTEPPGRPI